jgi:alpha-1,6-mannosyltransferase
MTPPSRKLPTIAQAGALLLSAAAYTGLAYATPRAEFGRVVALMGLALAAYAWLLHSRLPLRWGLGAALLLRLLWLPAAPALSDDVYRFRWDGLLVAHGVNPFRFRPDELIADGARTALPAAEARSQALPELQQLYRQLNSPHYYSVYPPVSQAVFGAAAWLFPTSQRGFVVVLRVVLLAAEAGTAWLLLALLPAFGWPARRALRYLLHPLVIVELTGNLHFEALAICFVLLTLWLLQRQQWVRSAGALGLAVAAKLLPLLALPLLVRRLGWRRFVLFAAVVGGALLVLFSPFISVALVVNISRSLNLYFRSFEFNASVYYLLRAVGYRLTTYNEIALIGPGLALATALLGLGLAWRERTPTLARLPQALLLLLTGYYALATTVHPWYITPLIALAPFTRFRYPLVWGGAAVLSYSAYRTSAYTENPWLIGLEYSLVYGTLVWDFFRPAQPTAPALTEA